MPAERKNVELVKREQGNVSKIHIGGIEMMKIKLLTTVLIVLAVVGVVTAAEVINVDIKGFNDNNSYVGNGAYDVGNSAVWIPFYGGWGMPVGSSRSDGLRREGQSGYPSVYASQVWIGDNGLIHGYDTNSTGLMNDGFTAASPNEPNISIWGQGAYRGVYDIYVYGRDAGSFILDQNVNGTFVQTTKTVSGDANAGEFKLGQNYVIFSDVNVNSSDSRDLYLTYTNKLNALQFVRKKDPCEISFGGTMINAPDYDVAGCRNLDAPLGSGLYGPAISGGAVTYIRLSEFMVYDINVSANNAGQYQIGLDVNTELYGLPTLQLYLDGKYLGDVNRAVMGDPCAVGLTTTRLANLFAGKHTIEWIMFPTTGYGNIVDVNLVYIDDINMVNCADVVFYGFTLPADYSLNCSVGLEDLALFVDNWLICNNPDPNGCL